MDITVAVRPSVYLNILIQFIKIINSTESDNIFCLLVGTDEDHPEFILCCTYIPPIGSPYHNEFIFDYISLDLLNLQAKYDVPFIMLGDFNSRTATLSDFVEFDRDVLDATGLLDDSSDCLFNLNISTRCNADKVVNTNGRGLLEFCKSFNLRIVNGRLGKDKNLGDFTCHKSNGNVLCPSVVDYAIVSDCVLPFVTDFAVDLLDKTLSDIHSPISLTVRKCLVSANEPVVEPETHDYTTHNIKTFKHKWKPGVGKEFCAAFSENSIENLENKVHSLDPNYTTQDKIDELNQELSDYFIKTAQSVGLFKEVRDQNFSGTKNYKRKYPQKPWFNKDCETKRQEYFDCKEKVRTAKTKQEKERLQNILDDKFKSYKHFLSFRQAQFRLEIISKLKSLKSNNPRDYYKLINSAIPSKRKEGDISLGTFMEHFKKLGDSPAEEHSFDPRNITHSISDDLNADFTFEEVQKVIKKLKNNKASGVDYVINEFLKNCPDSLVVVIVEMFNLVLKTGIVPEDWAIGIIQPLYKNKGSINSPDNYRGITLLSCIGKLFTSCFNARLSIFADCRGLIGEEQAGFREGYSTQDHSFVLHTIIDLYKQCGKRLYVAFVDFKKAFDLIKRTALWQKMIAENINGNFIRVIFNLYEQAKSCVKKGGKLSQFFVCNAGVRQGENLSPFLFAIYLNDFNRFVAGYYDGLSYLSNAINKELSDDDVEFFVKLFILLYADDTIIMAESEQQLQLALNGAATYCRNWDLTVNLTKTKIIIFSKGRVTKHIDFTFNGKPVEVVDDYVYLGTTFNYNGNTAKAITKQIDQGRKAMFSLLTKAKRLELPIDVVLDLFDKTVLPVLLYGCEVWGHTNIVSLEIFYRKFLKIVLHVGLRTPSCKVYGETGKLPLAHSIRKRILSFWIKISEGKELKYSTVIYKLIFKLHSSGQFYFSWVDYIKSSLFSCGYQNMWLQQDRYSPPFTSKLLFKTHIFKALETKAVEDWREMLFTSDNSTIYRLYKSDLCLENYLCKPNLSKLQIINLSKFRCGSNKIPVNNFWLQENEKYCQLCDRGEIGNEYHYLFNCKFFEHERLLYLKHYFRFRPNTEKMKKLFGSKNRKTLADLSVLTKIIMQKFQ